MGQLNLTILNCKRQNCICQRTPTPCQNISLYRRTIRLRRRSHEDIFSDPHRPASRRCFDILTRCVVSICHALHDLILVTGQEDIESLEKSIQLFANRLPQEKIQVLITPMYAAQSPGANAKAFALTPPGTRKCILATNIAETSITISGVKYVIDTGKCKEKRYLARDTGGGAFRVSPSHSALISIGIQALTPS